VGRFAVIGKRQPQNLPVAYYSPFFIPLMKLDDELSEEELLVSDYSEELEPK